MADETPPEILVWVCSRCGYWRQERTTGVHVVYSGRGPGESHKLEQTVYIYLSPASGRDRT